MQPCDVNPQFQQNMMKTIFMGTTLGQKGKSSKLGLTLSEIIYVQNWTNILIYVSSNLHKHDPANSCE